jgi:hypothetical protein
MVAPFVGYGGVCRCLGASVGSLSSGDRRWFLSIVDPPNVVARWLTLHRREVPALNILRKLAILTEFFCVFPQFLLENARIAP